MKLRNLTFNQWLRSHPRKSPRERWLRELYPWPVLAQVELDAHHINRTQRIEFDGASYSVTLSGIRWQQSHGTYRYRVRVESAGLGWHSRSYADDFDICGTPDGDFVTLFHAKSEEPLEKMARAFFGRRWASIDPALFKTLAVSRYLAASITGQVAEEAFADIPLIHYPSARLSGSPAPMLAHGSELWIGHRFHSEDAHEWARRSVGRASRIVAFYFSDTKYQFRTDLPSGAEVLSVPEVDANALSGRYEDLIRALLRGLELPRVPSDLMAIERILLGHDPAPATPVSESDVSESLAAMKRSCSSKEELRYQLAAAVVLNSWIESERRLGWRRRSKFYAFKQKVDALVRWAASAGPPGVEIWADSPKGGSDPIIFIRIDGVDFSFHAVPMARDLIGMNTRHPEWTGVRLKAIAPLVLEWARIRRSASSG